MGGGKQDDKRQTVMAIEVKNMKRIFMHIDPIDKVYKKGVSYKMKCAVECSIKLIEFTHFDNTIN